MSRYKGRQKKIINYKIVRKSGLFSIYREVKEIKVILSYNIELIIINMLNQYKKRKTTLTWL